MADLDTDGVTDVAVDILAGVTGGEQKDRAQVGVYERAPHLWKPGQSGNPAGRPKSAKLYKAELVKRFSPEQLADYWMDALRIAKDKEDAGAMGRILKDITEQLMGKAVATNIQVRTKYEEMLLLRIAAGEEGEAIDGELAE